MIITKRECLDFTKNFNKSKNLELCLVDLEIIFLNKLADLLGLGFLEL